MSECLGVGGTLKKGILFVEIFGGHGDLYVEAKKYKIKKNQSVFLNPVILK